jgi:hypothetical protein
MAYPHAVAVVDGQAHIVVECRECNAPQELTVPAESYLAWRKGQYIQDALSMLNNDQREMLISGTCPLCWDRLFGGQG